MNWHTLLPFEYPLHEKQIEAIEMFMQNGGRLLLAHIPGSGKTWIYLSAFLLAEYVSKGNLQATIICPATLVTEMWDIELRKYGLQDKIKAFSFEYARLHPEVIQGDMLIIDEIHRAKNYASDTLNVIRSEAERKKIKFRIGGTGTLQPRDYTDNWSPLALIYSDFINYHHFCNKFGQFNKHVYKWFSNFYTRQELQCYLADYIHVVRDVPGIPDVNYHFHGLEMTDIQRECYGGLALPDNTHIRILPGQIKLIQKQICSDYRKTKDKLWTFDGKINKLRELVQTIDHRPIIIWTTFKVEYTRIANMLKDYGRTAIWAGGTKKSIQSFNNREIDFPVCHAKSVGAGLNMQHVCFNNIYMSMDWGLIEFEQSLARTKRLGQKHTVNAHFVGYNNSIEEKVWKRLTDRSISQDELYKGIEEHYAKEKRRLQREQRARK